MPLHALCFVPLCFCASVPLLCVLLFSMSHEHPHYQKSSFLLKLSDYKDWLTFTNDISIGKFCFLAVSLPIL